jgi:hypothetical protein
MMSKQKLNKYLVTKTTHVVYQVYADSDARAKEMIERQAHRGAGSYSEEGYTTFMFSVPLDEYQVLTVPPQNDITETVIANWSSSAKQGDKT